VNSLGTARRPEFPTTTDQVFNAQPLSIVSENLSVFFRISSDCANNALMEKDLRHAKKTSFPAGKPRPPPLRTAAAIPLSPVAPMNVLDCTDRYCVIGAGPCGLAAVKNLRQADIPVDCFEREADLGGLWNYDQPSRSVCHSTHLISSRRLTQYTDFPMPADYPAYPSHRQALAYLQSYARHFGLIESIHFRAAVERIEPSGPHWEVRLAGESAARRYGGVILASGHHWDAKIPAYPGRFDGLAMHSREYKTPDVLAGRRVLVVGAGNSGCDIAVEAAQHASAAFLSMRRGYHFLPKFLFGKPIDETGEMVLRWGLPLWLRRAVARLLLRVAVGDVRRYGLPAPDHRLFESHPIVNSQLLYFAGHGRIRVKPDVARLAGDRVQFADGSEEPVDVVVYATGYNVSFPYIDPAHLNWRDGRPGLYLNAFHPRRDNLFVVGLIQPNSGLWGLADYQARLMAAFLRARREDPDAAEWFRRTKSDPAFDRGDGIRYLATSRHALEVEYFAYRENLKKLLARMERGLPARRAAAKA
jgi:hypothetical protein